MIQSHSLVLWREPDGPAKESVERGYATLQALLRLGREFAPTYVTAKRKSDAREFNCTLEEYESLVAQNMNREGKTLMPDLGSTFSFFSSFHENDSAKISLTVGMVDKKFYNTFIMSLPVNYVADGDLASQQTYELLKTCVDAFQPFWGAVINKPNVRRFGNLWAVDKPTTVHWLNYFDASLAERIGRDRLQQADVYRAWEQQDGLFLQSTERPIDDTSEVDLKRQKEINEALHFA